MPLTLLIAVRPSVFAWHVCAMEDIVIIIYVLFIQILDHYMFLQVYYPQPHVRLLYVRGFEGHEIGKNGL